MRIKNAFRSSSIAVSVVALLLAAQAGRAAEVSATPLPSLAPLVEAVKGSVVNVEVQSKVTGPRLSMGENPDDFFDHFFGRGGGRNRPRGSEPLRQGAGSGFIIDPKGLVLTNNHVVQDAVSIRVKLDDGREFEGKTVGRDPLTDVALVRLTGNVQNLPVVKLGDSDAMRVGDWVVAIGNPFGLASSVSAGIISAKSRDIRASTYDDFLQTDAAINPGNSGGPLFNLKGEVIGINTAIVGGGTGIGFAVPSNMAKSLLPQLEKEGTVSRGYLGVGIQDLTPDLAKGLGVPAKEGAVVTEVRADGPAKKAGLQTDDVITGIDGQKVPSRGALTRAVGAKRPGATATLDVFRGSKQMEIKVVLAPRPDLEGVNQQSQSGGSDEESTWQQKSGLSLRNVEPRYAQSIGAPTEGALVTDVAPGSPAERAGLAPGMIITEISRKPVRNSSEAVRALKSAKSGSTVLIRALQRGVDSDGSPSPSPTLHALAIP
ncbi:MAG TPA: Do family serine endopeptidase [Myxococcaceae bacterium]|nr:Do family serine endopeptidase [Myxococcaceae bacterium]